MSKAMWVAQAMLLASTTFVLAQAGKTQSAPPDTPPPKVLSQTGTMYDGNNANLQLPAEPNSYWVELWAAPISTGTVSSASEPEAGHH